MEDSSLLLLRLSENSNHSKQNLVSTEVICIFTFLWYSNRTDDHKVDFHLIFQTYWSAKFPHTLKRIVDFLQITIRIKCRKYFVSLFLHLSFDLCVLKHFKSICIYFIHFSLQHNLQNSFNLLPSVAKHATVNMYENSSNHATIALFSICQLNRPHRQHFCRINLHYSCIKDEEIRIPIDNYSL